MTHMKQIWQYLTNCIVIHETNLVEFDKVSSDTHETNLAEFDNMSSDTRETSLTKFDKNV